MLNPINQIDKQIFRYPARYINTIIHSISINIDKNVDSKLYNINTSHRCSIADYIHKSIFYPIYNIINNRIKSSIP